MVFLQSIHQFGCNHYTVYAIATHNHSPFVSFSETADDIVEKLQTCINGIGFIMDQEQAMHTMGLLTDSGRQSKKKVKGEDTPILALEHVLQKMACALQQSLCKGVLYFLVMPPDTDGDIYIR